MVPRDPQRRPKGDQERTHEDEVDSHADASVRIRRVFVGQGGDIDVVHDSHVQAKGRGHEAQPHHPGPSPQGDHGHEDGKEPRRSGETTPHGPPRNAVCPEHFAGNVPQPSLTEKVAS